MAQNQKSRKNKYRNEYNELENVLFGNGPFEVFRENELKGTRIVPLDAVVIERSKNRCIVIEIKSETEVSDPIPWKGKGLNFDYIESERKDIRQKYDDKKIAKEVARHEIFMAQAERRARQCEQRQWGLRDPGKQGDVKGKSVQVGYMCPRDEKDNVVQALKDKGIRDYEIREGVSTLLAIYDNPIS